MTKTGIKMGAGLKVIVSVIFFLALSLTAQAQRVTVINGTDSSQYVPINFNLRHSVSEMIYLQPQISASGLITKIGFYQVRGGGGYPPVDSVKIFLKHTNNSSFSAGGLNTSGYTQVFFGDIPNGFPNYATGWVEITLDTPFYYDNVANLQVMVLRQFGMWNGGVVGNLPFYRRGINLNRNATRWLSAFGGFDATSVLNPSTELPNLLLQFGTVSGKAKAADPGSIRLYPNPVQNFLYLPEAISYSYLTVSDLSGKVLLQLVKPNRRLDLSRFAAGIYIVSLFQQDKVQRVKVVKE